MSAQRPLDDNQVQPIPIGEFISRPQVLVDTFLRLSSNKFILVAKAGQNTPFANLEKYKEKNIVALYVRIEDYRRLLMTTIHNASEILAGRKASNESRFNIIQDAMEAVYREASDLGFNDQVFQHARLVNHATMTYIKENPALGELIEKFGMLSRDGMAHSMMVSLVSVMLGQKHEWVKPATLEKLGLGGFLHDIGKTKLPPAVFEKSYETMSKDDRVIFHSHCETGRQLLAQAKTVPDDVLLIVYEHHERADGSGFPKGLKDFQISPLARVVALANAFVDRIADEGKPLNQNAAQRVFEEFSMHRGSQFNRDAMRALAKCLDLKTTGNKAAG